MRQQTLAMAGGFERFGRKTQRGEFLSQMEVVVPWSDLVGLIEPHYPKAGNGRPPIGMERMLRIYFLTCRTHRRYPTKLVCYPEIRKENREKSRTRSRVERLFAILKLKFGFVKARYRGLAKNLNRLLSTCVLANLLTARNHLLQGQR